MIIGKEIVCPHCGGKTFTLRLAVQSYTVVKHYGRCQTCHRETLLQTTVEQ